MSENQKIDQTASGNDKAERGHSDADTQSMQVYRPRKWLALVVTSGLAVVAASGFGWLIWASGAFENASEGVKFVTEGSIAFSLLLVAIVQACVYWSQRRIMTAQWDAMERSLKAVERQEEHLSAQVEVARDAADMAKGQLVAMQHQEQAQLKALEQNERMAKAAEDNAKTARDAFYVGEAPYFGIVNIEFNDLVVGHAPTLVITFMNGGKTPAWLFRASPLLIYGDLPTTGDYWNYFAVRENIADSFVPSGDRKTITYQSNDFNYTAEQQKTVGDESSYIFVVLTLTYRDFRKRDHKRVFQYIWNRTDGCFMDFEATNDTPPE